MGGKSAEGLITSCDHENRVKKIEYPQVWIFFFFRANTHGEWLAGEHSLNESLTGGLNESTD